MTGIAVLLSEKACKKAKNGGRKGKGQEIYLGAVMN
jgi:hypothetical protein